MTKAYDLALWLLPTVENLPKSYRFTVGLRLTDASLELLLALVERALACNGASACFEWHIGAGTEVPVAG